MRMGMWVVLAAQVAFVGALACAAPASAGKLDDVKKAGVVHCGIAMAGPGYAFDNGKGEIVGFDVDECHALAAAIFGDASKIKLTRMDLKTAFATLPAGGVDVLTHRLTQTFTRDVGTGVDPVRPMVYDGQGFILKKSLGVTKLADLSGATFCLAQGTTTELNVADYFRTHNLQYKSVSFASQEQASDAYAAGRCDVYSNDAFSLRARRMSYEKPDDHIILNEIISKEPIGPWVSQGDDNWKDLVYWTMNLLIAAEEDGITQANVDEMKAKSTNPEVQRILGVTENFGGALGLTKEWGYNVIKQVGNYGDMWEKWLGPKTPIGAPRGVNSLWTQGGLMIAPPFR